MATITRCKATLDTRVGMPTKMESTPSGGSVTDGFWATMPKEELTWDLLHFGLMVDAQLSTPMAKDGMLFKVGNLCLVLALWPNVIDLKTVEIKQVFHANICSIHHEDNH